MFGKVAILGAGLLGGSLAAALKKMDKSISVAVWSRSAKTRDKCANLPFFDEVFDSPQRAVCGADLVVFSTVTSAMGELAVKVAPFLEKGAIVTDVGSVKAKVCADCTAALAGSKGVFVGSHPMAGSEKVGVDFADENLFQNRICMVCGGKDSEKVGDFWTALGMKVVFVEPEMHDAIVARISHMPHLLAGLLCVNASKFPKDLRKYAGPGFRDTTRVSSGSVDMWKSIVPDNRDEILSALKEYSADLNLLISALENRDWTAVANLLQNAKEYRDNLI